MKTNQNIWCFMAIFVHQVGLIGQANAKGNEVKSRPNWDITLSNRCMLKKLFSAEWNNVQFNLNYQLYRQISRAANHSNCCGIITIFCSSVRPYSESYDKSVFSCNSSIWCSSITVLSAHLSAWLYFGEYPQAVAFSAQPLWCSSHGSCSRPHGLKAYAVHFFLILWGWCVLPMQEILSFVQCFLIQR